MTVDQAAFSSVVQEQFLVMVSEQHGENGTRAIRSVMAAIIGVYHHVEPELFRKRVVVFCQVDSSTPNLEGSTRGLDDFADVQDRVQEGLVLEITLGGEYRLWVDADPDVADLSEHAVVYAYEDGADHFYARRERRRARTFPGLQSWFVRPVFNDLRQALLHYRLRLVRTSRCPIFSEAWADNRRLFFAPKPERLMRSSLERHLVSSLRDSDVEVRPEQNVDESHPVDIRVTFQFEKRVAIIEIKWLGKSKNEKGGMTTYGPARARDGAEQLAEYLDWNRTRAPTTITHGYLVVIDGRRWGLNVDSEEVSRANGMYFANNEIEYRPEYHNERSDFKDPLRMFAEPVCSLNAGGY